MGKFSDLPTLESKSNKIHTSDVPTFTYEGAYGWELHPVDELFSLLVTSFVEDTFYEPKSEQLERLRALTHAAVGIDPQAVADMVRWARHEGNMRSAPIVVACEYAFINPLNGVSARKVIDSVCLRADEPAEILGYWMAMYGRSIPSRVKRGVADAVKRLYTQRSSLRYDGSNNAIRFGDVIELVHPAPDTDIQSVFFRYLIDKRHNRKNLTLSGEGVNLDILTNELELRKLAPSKRRGVPTDALFKAGMSWERYAGWIPGPMDGEAWAKVIPLMGYMALLRNLRNFEKAKIPSYSVDHVRRVLTDPDQIDRSRQLPFRFWSAYKNTHGSMFSFELEMALDRVFVNSPKLSGRTIVFVDVSGSMRYSLSQRGTTTPAELATVFASAINASSDADVVAFATRSEKIDLQDKSTLRGIQLLQGLNHLGGGTEMWPAIAHYCGLGLKYDRVIVLTDMQVFPGRESELACPIYFWDLKGYGKAPTKFGEKNYMLTGISDKAFSMITHIEGLTHGKYPWS